MENEYLKTLWVLRFEKIKTGEIHAAESYQKILDECLVEYGKDDESVCLLSQLVKEECAHAKLAEELIKICHCSHPEISALSFDRCEQNSRSFKSIRTLTDLRDKI